MFTTKRKIANVAPSVTKQDWRYDQIGTIQYVSGSKQVLELPRGPHYREIMMRHQGAPTLTGANNTLANTLRGGEHGAIQKIEIVADGSFVLRTFTPDFLLWYNLCLGHRPYVTPTIGDGSTANPAYDAVLSIPFWTVSPNRSGNSIDGCLRSGDYGKLTLEITWNTNAYAFINSAATAWTTPPSIDVSSYYAFGNKNLQYLRLKNSLITETPTGANSAYNLKLTPNKVYHSFLINAQNSSNVDAAGILTNLKLRSGGNIYANLAETVMRQQIRNRYGIGHFFERSLNSGTGGTGKPFQSAKTNSDGWFYLPMLGDGYVSEARNTIGLSEFIAELNISGASTINIMPFEVLPD